MREVGRAQKGQELLKTTPDFLVLSQLSKYSTVYPFKTFKIKHKIMKDKRCFADKLRSRYISQFSGLSFLFTRVQPKIWSKTVLCSQFFLFSNNTE